MTEEIHPFPVGYQDSRLAWVITHRSGAPASWWSSHSGWGPEHKAARFETEKEAEAVVALLGLKSQGEIEVKAL